ncbi:hypothetical protein Val02_12650 [Virgisporangium aliadipatigenens]|uniref:Uncharacterized protein n=1 Tax=Virgisporangium aliadipatigenens TaxID=741659 RepID=A0A8J4DNG2_9ACTN|nr:hypothetical protein [Virgisporangium aliadipatigenens]GIJ44379.1 hypothetical protein Val02_12650 [Virgisporangium aliadipatigenens]
MTAPHTGSPPAGGLWARAAPLAPDSVLRALAAACADTEIAGRPVVRLRLASGQVETGRLIRVGVERTDEVVVLGLPAERHRPPDEALYVRVRSVVAVGVLEAEQHRDVLSGGTLAAPVTGEPVTRLALRRRYAPTAELPLRPDWDTCPDTPEALANLAAVLEAVRTAADAVRADALGRQAWAAVGAVRLAHRPGEPLTVRRGPDGLTLAVDLIAALPRHLTDEVTRGIESVL